MTVRKTGVCFLMPKAYPLFNPAVEGVFGGAEVDLYYLATELAKDERFAVSFVVADYGQPGFERREGVDLISSVDFGQDPGRGAWRIWRALKRADASFYVTKTAGPGAVLLAAFCRRHGRGFVYRTAHRYECDGTYLREHAWLGRAFKWSLRQAWAVFVQNADDAELLEATTGVHGRVVANGHRLGPVGLGERAAVLWVGRSAGFKHAERFVRLAKEMPEVGFTMICQRATGDMGYDELVAEARGIGNLDFVERVGFDEVGEYYRRAKVLVNTSDAEGFANTFIQACAAGTPVLTYLVQPDGFPERHGAGYCAGGDWGRFVGRLREMLVEEHRQEMGRKAREYAQGHHDISAIVDEYKRAFQG